VQTEPTTTMTHETLKAAFLQGGEQEAANLLREMTKAAVRAALFEAMAQEVEALCGPAYHPDPEAACRRAGSESGVAYLGGEREEITRPRVRDSEGEVRLDTYAAASTQRHLFAEVVRAVASGASIRGVAKSRAGSLGKSKAAEMWAEIGREKLEQLRSRDLSGTDWLAMMVDGVFLTDELCAVVAIGIDADGTKQVLDFQEGTSESAECVSGLLRRISERGFAPMEGHRLLVCRDGSGAIAKAVSRHWPDAVQQECLVHCERNVSDKLKRADRPEARRLFARLRAVEGADAGKEAFGELAAFVESRNAAAGAALRERERALTAVHRLEVPSTLHRTFLSTNCIENVIRNWRAATKGVKRWQEKGDMVQRWLSTGLLYAEEGFRKVSGHSDLGALRDALVLPLSPSGDSGPCQSTPTDQESQN
jgi:putative transposase